MKKEEINQIRNTILIRYFISAFVVFLIFILINELYVSEQREITDERYKEAVYYIINPLSGPVFKNHYREEYEDAINKEYLDTLCAEGINQNEFDDEIDKAIRDLYRYNEYSKKVDKNGITYVSERAQMGKVGKRVTCDEKIREIEHVEGDVYFYKHCAFLCDDGNTIIVISYEDLDTYINMNDKFADVDTDDYLIPQNDYDFFMDIREAMSKPPVNWDSCVKKCEHEPGLIKMNILGTVYSIELDEDNRIKGVFKKTDEKNEGQIDVTYATGVPQN